MTGSFENSFASWTIGSTTHKNKKCCLIHCVKSYVSGSATMGDEALKKKINNYFFHFNFQIH